MFRYEALPMRVRFGPGAVAQLAEELRDLGRQAAVLLCTPAEEALARRIAGELGELAAGVLSGAVMHVPDDAVASARVAIADRGADVLVPVGGGSAVGLAKALALETGLPIVAVPTTYAGSEMTPIWGRTSDGVKVTGRDRRVLPEAVVYDPELTLGLPAHVSGVSGMNAIAHAVEALYAPDATPVVTLMAIEGVRLLAGALPVVVERPDDLAGRSDALQGAWLCGACLGNVTMSLHHKLCHALGGAFDLPHADTHALVLPYVLAFNAPAVPDAVARLAGALGEGEPAAALWRLGRSVGAPASLAELGLTRADVDHVAALAAATPYANPRPAGEDDIRDVLLSAWRGGEPNPARP